MAQRSLTTACVVILALAVVFTALQQAKDIFAPIVSALLLGVILTPLSKIWGKLRVPDALSAALSVCVALLVILAFILLIEPYATEAINQAPVIWNELRGTIERIKFVLRGLEQVSEDVAAAIEPASDGAKSDGESKETVTLPSITDALFYAPRFAAQFMIFSGTLYFFLLVKNSLYHWVSTSTSYFNERDLRQADAQVSRYVLTISTINLTFGVIVAIVMKLIGMPSPFVWGLLAFALNFVVYLGPIALVAMLIVTGIFVFDGVMSFVPAAIYLLMNATEAQFVTPTLVGKSLSVNPLMVFLSLVFWLWLWGPIGGIIAIPLLIWVLTVMKGLTFQPVTNTSHVAST